MKVYYSTDQDKLSQFLDSMSIEHAKWNYGWAIFFFWEHRETNIVIRSSTKERFDRAKIYYHKVEFIDISEIISFNHLSKYKIKPTI